MASNSVGGLTSLMYAVKVASKVGYGNFLKSITSRNTCKTCAYGMGGQRGGMINEAGTSLEICKKSIQAQLTDIQGAIPEAIFKKNTISELKKQSGKELEMLGRLNFPLYKEKSGSHFKKINWNDALNKVVQQFKKSSPEETFFYSSGRSSNEAGFILQLFARLYGTNNINNCSYYCHQASGVGMNATIGSGTATIQLEDLKKADLIFVFGANPSSNHPRFLTELMHCRRRGGNVVIVNPVKEPGLLRFTIPSDIKSMLSGGSPIASEYIQPKIGGDIAFIKGIAKVLISNNDYDNDFIKEHTNCFEDYCSDINNTIWEDIVESSGVDKKSIEHIASLYLQSKNTVFSWSMGITHHHFGVDNVESIVNLALIRGMVGRKYAGLLPLRGHSNVQGIGSVGMTPQLKEQVFKNIEEKLSVKLPKEEGMDTMACMNAAYNDKVNCAFLLGGNLFGSNPDTKFAEESLAKIPFKVFLNTTLNQGHLFGSDGEVIILPCAARDEEIQSTTQESMFNFVRKSDGGILRLNNVRSETEIICDLAIQILGTIPVDFSKFKKHSNIREAIACTIPGFEKLMELEKSGEEFQISGRTFHSPEFHTKNKRANFKAVKIPESQIYDQSTYFQMMTVRSEGQFNTIIYEEQDVFRNQKERWIVLMNKHDMEERQLKENDLVDINNQTGEMKRVKVRVFDIKKSCLLTYFPEANILISNDTDPRSKTPGFKSVKVKISKCNRNE